ncbi:MAG TPA: M23 family metallopeptidase, partial [Humibacillus xanthopallidus]|nr:M23 family metallopeptidase [Humibacillus xanthopallidus]
MGDDARPKGPFVLNIRMSGRIVPFAAGLTMFAVLPFLGGSAPNAQRADVVLAAGTPAQAAVQNAVGAVEVARAGLADHATSALLGDAVAVGGGNAAFSGATGLFMFPSLNLALSTAQAVAAPVVGPPSTTGFIHPVPGGEVSPFGPRIHPLLHRAMFHTGIDLQASCGTPIRAAADGTVIYARVSNSWGLRTIIQHTSGVKTAYGHQSKFLVKEGDVVKQGQVIGLVGTTGWSTGCHLHFDVIINDRYVDPAPYLGFPASAADSIPYAVVPHFVIDQSGRTVQTVQDGDVPIPSGGSAGSSSSVDGSGSTPSTPSTTPTTTRPTTSGSGTTTRPPTSSGTGTPTPTGTSSGTGTPTTGTTSGSSTTTTQPPTQTTTSSPTTATNPPATSTTTTTTAADPTPTDPPTSSTSQSTSSAEQSVTTSDPAPASTSGSTSKSLAASDSS